MLISHTLKYLPAQVVSPLAQLVSMVLWTHWLAPAELGVFTLVTVAQEMAYLFCVGWFSVYALRFLPPDTDADARRRYLGTENAVLLGSVLLGLSFAAVTAATLPQQEASWQRSLLIGLFFVTRGANAHYAERARAQSAFAAYTVLQTAGPVGGLCLGWLALQRFEPDAWTLLAAYGAAQAVGTLLALPLLGVYGRLVRPDVALLRAAAGFGFPLLGLGLLGWLGENYVRYLVQWQAGAAALGLMIVGWSLGRRCAGVATMLVATAAYPLVARLLNENRRDEALAQLKTNAALMLSVLLPVTVALQWLGPLIVALTVAPRYQVLTAALLGLAVWGGAVRNLHLHATDQLIVLERRMRMMAAIHVFEIVACTAVSVGGLYWFGLKGAVVGQALGSLLTFVLSLYLAQTRLGFRWPWLATLKIALASGVMAGVLAWLALPPTLLGLVVGTAVGALSYALATALLFSRELARLWAARPR